MKVTDYRPYQYAPSNADLLSDKRQALLNSLKSYQHGTNLAATTALFEELESADPRIATEANATLDFLLANECNFYTIALSSLPAGVPYSEMQKIALEQSNSSNSFVKGRAHVACTLLVNYKREEGFSAAAAIASEKLHNRDKKTQEEGLAYFGLLLKRSKPSLAQEDLAAAIKVAEEMIISEEPKIRFDANQFFEELIENGQGEDIKKIGDFLENPAVIHHCNYAIELCKKMITHHKQCNELLQIPLQAAVNGSQSDTLRIRDESFSLFWNLLNWAPELSMESLIQAIGTESKRETPSVGLIGRLQELAGHDFSNLSQGSREVIERRAKEDAVPLLEALDCVSQCKISYTRQVAAQLKETLENRLQNS